MPPVYEPIPGGIRLRLRIQPKSRREGPQGVVALPEGGLALKFGVNAAPEDGKANAAIIALLARRLKVAKAAISVAAGAKDRRKLVDIQGPSETLAAALDAWLGPLSETSDDGAKS
ncbi:MAG: DUF167 domain-containing protein [Rhodospirillaceae bacterium]|nr:DUF167 domain-containing protein [Rhodospirillaceae bacterium]